MVTELETSATKGNHREVRLGSKADYEAKLSSGSCQVGQVEAISEPVLGPIWPGNRREIRRQVRSAKGA